MLKHSYKPVFIMIIFLCFSMSCADLKNFFGMGIATDKKSGGEISDHDGESHQICDEYKDWRRQITANDSEGRVYYIFTCKDRIVFLSPYNTLLYSRSGDVIGFQRDGIFHFHEPSKGWKKGIDVSNVGVIKNQYEGYSGIPDLTGYKTPPTLVSK